MELGRALGPEDDTPGAEATVVLAHDYWMRLYDGDASVIGQTIRLNNEPYTIVGVARPDFMGSTSARRPEFWIPFEQYKRVYWARSDRENDREAGAVSAYVRLPRRLDAANEAMAAFAASLDRAAPLEDGARRLRLEAATWIDRWFSER